jgi:ABC-type lipoprotein release transport system permease subunit
LFVALTVQPALIAVVVNTAETTATPAAWLPARRAQSMRVVSALLQEKEMVMHNHVMPPPRLR